MAPDVSDEGVDATDDHDAAEGAGLPAETEAASDPPAKTPRRGRRGPPSAEVRRRIQTLDVTERRLAFAAAGVVALVSAVFIPYLLHRTITYTAEKTKHGVCPYKRYPGEPSGCHLATLHYPADYVPYFIAILVLALVVLYGAIRSRRTLVAFAALLAGFAVSSSLSPVVGILLLFFGGWLLVRAWRVQRYGAADAKTVRKVASERAAERRAARDTQASSKGDGPASPGARAKVTASKRYTPKAQGRRRR